MSQQEVTSSLLAYNIINKKISSKSNNTTSEIRIRPSVELRQSINEEVENGLQNIKEQKIKYQPLNDREKIVAEAVVRGWKARKVYKKLRKNANQRMKALEQLFTTEKVYRQALQLLNNHLRKPLLQQEIITEAQDQKYFPNFLQIIQISDQMLAQLTPRFQQLHFYQKIGDILIKKAPFFTIYTQYINNQEQYWTNVQDPRIKEVMKKFEEVSYQNNNALSYLIKPFQRLTKYKILITPILKFTSPQHPDYNNLQLAEAAFGSTVQKVNDLKDRILMNRRIQQLDTEFSKDMQILENNRRLIFQEQLTWFHQGKTQVKAYFFNDIILFVNEETIPKKIVRRLTWNEKSTVNSLDDGKTMANVVNISCQDGNVTLECGKGYQGAQKKVRLLDNINRKMMNQSDENVIIQSLGTQQLNSTSLSKHTIYIMQVKIGPFRQNIFIRFKQLLAVLSQLTKYYKDLKLPSLQKKWFTNHKSNIIQQRKVQILQIIQTILNDPDVQKSPQFMLVKLQLRKDFYQLPKKIKQQRQKNKNQINGKKKLGALYIFCMTQLKLGKYNFHGDQDYTYLDDRKSEFPIEVKLMTGQVLKLKIKDTDTVEAICNKVSTRIGLTMNRDFRLFHEIGKKQSRALDHDRVVIKIFDIKEEQQQGLLSKLKNNIVNFIVPDSRPVLSFKKYLYLPMKHEQHEYKRDIIRLELWIHQIFFQIKDMKYHLGHQQYCFFAATYLYIQSKGQVQKYLTSRKINLQSLQQAIIPELFYKSQNISEDQWRQKILKPLKRLDQEIIAMKNYNEKNVSTVKKDIKIKLYLDKMYLCCLIVFNKIKTNFLFESNLFYVQPHEQLSKILQNVQLSHNMWLAIKLQGISLLKPSNKQPVFQIKYNQISTKTVHPSTIIFNMYNQNKYKFNTYQSFQISQLIDYIKKLNQVLEIVNRKQVSQEDTVNTSIYIESVMKHRESCK